ncbi:glycine dehydrogenase (decarboxylating) alpha subunit [Anaerobranca californiensis DSM 14826]|jgi:glycine dehydrogenase subunit 1|uniref:Probable glycine dehydrogenase (decarboxylating) subunit 1 n=1 Tax=Anaerobranca californiensis DSM 14826 TaxID=1120989 RepID=A0A1M6L8Y8_9FIRM|nr:aminomethyl-transferring glycine dehydrogenase subunit GcvPA [Anaerobranca californiensis]SHJ67656.1 glycine dehydrogenase (decarboxylating) alpha subunit [Anaerobranca californiensis DSM 14826]
MVFRYIPKTDVERQEMLKSIGKNSVEELFAHIPQQVRFQGEMDLPKPHSELELSKKIGQLAGKNKSNDKVISFLGGGSYDHYIPSVVNHILLRSEFYTAYTPYQAEISQGVLQSIFEFQSMICRLTGMDVANASMYDGATAMAEAALVAVNHNRKDKILISEAVHPHYREVLKTYAAALEITVETIPFNLETGQTEVSGVEERLTDDVAGVIIQSPNFFGIVENMPAIGELLKDKKPLFIAVVDPISLGILNKPSSYYADIVVGEGQSLGIPLSFGGPYLGFFATTNKLIRKIPGRIVGETKDKDGKRGFVLTLQTREQHIRRDKATSNICSNQALCALAASVYMSLMGEQGLKKVATLSLQKAHYFKEKLAEKGFKPLFTGPTFKEFSFKMEDFGVLEVLKKEDIYLGIPLEKYYPQLKGGVLTAVTEKRSIDEMDTTLKRLEESL